MAKKVHGTHGCYVVPAITGLGAPHWDQYARGTIVGLTRGTNKNHIIRATLESIALQVCDVIDAMRADAGIDLKSLKVDGGASANNFLMQFQADMINAPVKRPQCVETTAMGAAYLAGLAVGYWKDKEDVVNNQKIDRIFTPEMEEEERKAKRKGWNKAVKYAYGWAKDEPEEKRNSRRVRSKLTIYYRMKRNRAEPETDSRGFSLQRMRCFLCSCRYPGILLNFQIHGRMS